MYQNSRNRQPLFHSGGERIQPRVRILAHLEQSDQFINASFHRRSGNAVQLAKDRQNFSRSLSEIESSRRNDVETFEYLNVPDLM